MGSIDDVYRVTTMIGSYKVIQKVHYFITLPVGMLLVGLVMNIKKKKKIYGLTPHHDTETNF